MYAPDNHCESIYQILPPKPIVVPRPERYKNKIPDYAPTASTFHPTGTSHPHSSNMAGEAVGKVVSDRGHASFGRPVGHYANDATVYLKKMQKSSSVPSLAEVKKTNPDALVPSQLKEPSRFVGGGGPPKRGERPVMNLVTTKNFVVANAVETILAAPKKLPNPVKDYLKKEDYGKVPKYLHKVKRDIAGEEEYIRMLRASGEPEEQFRPLSEEERLSMLDGLKAKWEQVNTEYQGATHLTILDTEGQIRRKEKHEANLAQTEKDIEKLSKRNIVVDAAF